MSTQQTVEDIVNKHDPIGLLRMDAPKDEYSPEIKIIILQLPACSTEDEVLDLVYGTFDKMFNHNAGGKESYRSLAAALYRLEQAL